MAKRSRQSMPEDIRSELITLLSNFETHLQRSDLRQQVRELVPAYYLLRNLGSSLMPVAAGASGRARILSYLRKYTGEVIDSDELMVVAGIGDYPRRIRELRVQEGWPILSGLTAGDLRKAAEEMPTIEDLPPSMKPEQYLLVEDKQDRDAAHRWHTANRIRRGPEGVQDKILAYFRANIGRPITSEELRYVANDRSEWARRTRELRTEEGWAITTRFNGNPHLPVGVYVLSGDEQAPPHDRHIPELVRQEVMQRDNYSCRWRGCGWSKERYDVAPRYLEVHHIEHHAAGGGNVPDNLVTLCNLHHDRLHAGAALDIVRTDCTDS